MLASGVQIADIASQLGISVDVVAKWLSKHNQVNEVTNVCEVADEG
jgi:uncharacterized protein YjcR